MADESELIGEREKKVAELRALGTNPYANGFAPQHTTADVVERFKGLTPPPADPAAPKGAAPVLLSEDRFSVAGRIVAYRGFGGATFVKLLDRAGELQVWVKKDVVGPEAFEIWKKMERGDFIGATGPALFTKTGELTILAEQVVVLTKGTRPLPETFHAIRSCATASATSIWWSIPTSARCFASARPSCAACAASSTAAASSRSRPP
jgi:lysyl-tRNA synthetase class 2